MARSGFRAGDRARAKERFRALPRPVRKATNEALDTSADELVAAIKRRVPKDQGDLAETVRKERGRAANKKAGIEAGTDADLTVRVLEGDRKNFQGPWLEHGTSKMPAQPHFWPTWRSMKRRLVGRVRRAQLKAVRDLLK